MPRNKGEHMRSQPPKLEPLKLLTEADLNATARYVPLVALVRSGIVTGPTLRCVNTRKYTHRKSSSLLSTQSIPLSPLSCYGLAGDVTGPLPTCNAYA